MNGNMLLFKQSETICGFYACTFAITGTQAVFSGVHYHSGLHSINVLLVAGLLVATTQLHWYRLVSH